VSVNRSHITITTLLCALRADWADLLTAAAAYQQGDVQHSSNHNGVTAATAATSASNRGSPVSASKHRSAARSIGAALHVTAASSSSDKQHASSSSTSNGSSRTLASGVTLPSPLTQLQSDAAAAATATAVVSGATGSSKKGHSDKGAAAVKPPSEQEVRAWLALPPYTLVEFKPDADADATLQEQLEEMHYKVQHSYGVHC
jgi:hypothetical protein